MLLNVVLTFESFDEVLSVTNRPIEMKATEQYFPCGAVYYAVQDGSNF